MYRLLGKCSALHTPGSLHMHAPPSMCTHCSEQAPVLCAHAAGNRISRNNVQLQPWEAMEARKENGKQTKEMLASGVGKRGKGKRRARCPGDRGKLGHKAATPCWCGQIERLQTKPLRAQRGGRMWAPFHLHPDTRTRSGLPLLRSCSTICIHVYAAWRELYKLQGHRPFSYCSAKEPSLVVVTSSLFYRYHYWD